MSDECEAFPRNRAIVIGRLYRWRDERRTGGRRRETNDLGGRIGEYELQTMTPYGEPYALRLNLASGAVGRSIGQLQGGANVMVTGEVRLQRSIDVRFALSPTDPNQRGLDVRELVLDVTELRAMGEEELAVGEGSAVWLEGEVAEPPYTTRHPSRPGLIYEATTLRISLERRSPVPGSRAVVTEEVRVAVAIPTDHPEAGLLRRAGNRVRVEGQLDCVMEMRRGREVAMAVGALDTEYAAQAAQVASDERALLALRRTYRGRMRGLLDTARLRVVAATVTALDGAEPLGRRLARAERTAYAQRRASRRETIAVAQARRREGGADMTEALVEEQQLATLAADAPMLAEPGATALLEPNPTGELRSPRRRRTTRTLSEPTEPSLAALVTTALDAVTSLDDSSSETTQPEAQTETAMGTDGSAA